MMTNRDSATPIPKTDKQWYICDPSKNVKCSKSGCKHNPAAAYPECYLTSHKEYELIPDNNKDL